MNMARDRRPVTRGQEGSDRWRATGDQKPRGEIDERVDMKVKRSGVESSKSKAFRGRMGQAPLDSLCVAQSGVGDCAFCALFSLEERAFERSGPARHLDAAAFVQASSFVFTVSRPNLAAALILTRTPL